jgi:CheY-like chemotaxis protein
MIAQKMLEKVGLTAVVAVNGQDALNVLGMQNFDLILMDCQMPEMDGFEASRIIREQNIVNTHQQEIPIIAMTANVMSGDRERCLEAGMSDYIGKPVQLDVLKQVLAKWLARDYSA